MTVTEEEQHLIRQMLDHLMTVDGWIERPLPDPLPGSSLAGDDARTDPLQLSHLAVQSIGVAVDHLHSIRMAMCAGPAQVNLHTYAPFTGTRAAIENASTALWMLLPASRQERIVRRLQLEADGVRNAASTLAQVGQGEGSSLTRQRERLAKVAKANRVSESLLTRQAKPTYTDIVTQAGGHIELRDHDTNYVLLMWRLCSAVAHGDSWINTFFDLEVLGPLSPGVSAVRITAPTPLLLAGVRAALALVSRAQHLVVLRGALHR